MKALIPLFAILLIGAAHCGTAAGSSAGSYDYPGAAGPAPTENVTSDGKIVTVSQALGDRMFTTNTSTYDSKTFALLSSKQHASCCGSYWNSTVTRNTDGTYDVEAELMSAAPVGKPPDVYKESRPHWNLQGDTPIIAGGLFFVPFLYHMTHAFTIAHLSFSPVKIDFLSVRETPAAPYPDHVPAHDKALLLTTTPNEPAITIWYDPCTFTLDAYGSRNGRVTVRSALL